MHLPGIQLAGFDLVFNGYTERHMYDSLAQSRKPADPSVPIEYLNTRNLLPKRRKARGA